MVNFGATHNFFCKQEARRLELKIKKVTDKMKAINFKALPIMGISKKSSLKLGKWRGDVYLVMIRIDDFNMLLGIEFLLKHKVIPMPLAQCMVVTSGSSTIVNEYVDVISHELPKSQPPRQEINHEIEYVPRAKPLAKNAYLMAPPNLAEFKRQLDALLAAEFIRPVKASYGAPMLFQKKKDGMLYYV